MRKTQSHRESVFGPLSRKNFQAVLAYELRQHVPTLGQLTSKALAQHLEGVIREHFPALERLAMGQIVWSAVAVEETGAYGKTIEQTRIRPVVLSLFQADDLEDYLRGRSQKQVRQKVAVRLFHQAYDQGGVLTRADVAAILGLDPSTITHYVQDHEKSTQSCVPRRGTVHDIGPSLTHKSQICSRVILQGQSIEETARATHHSPEAVTRYVRDYRRILHCLKSGLSIRQTAYVTRRSKRLVDEYAKLQEEHRTLEKPTRPKEPNP